MKDCPELAVVLCKDIDHERIEKCDIVSCCVKLTRVNTALSEWTSVPNVSSKA